MWQNITAWSWIYAANSYFVGRVDMENNGYIERKLSVLPGRFKVVRWVKCQFNRGPLEKKVAGGTV